MNELTKNGLTETLSYNTVKVEINLQRAFYPEQSSDTTVMCMFDKIVGEIHGNKASLKYAEAWDIIIKAVGGVSSQKLWDYFTMLTATPHHSTLYVWHEQIFGKTSSPLGHVWLDRMQDRCISLCYQFARALIVP